MSINAKEICTTKFICFEDSESLEEVLKSLKENRYSGCIVKDKNGNILGFLSERRFLFSKDLVAGQFSKPISCFSDVFENIPSVSSLANPREILKALSSSQSDLILVLENDEICGVITPKDIVAVVIDIEKDRELMLKEFSQLQKELSDYSIVDEFQKYRDIVEKSPDMIHSVSEDGKIIEVNETECSVLGYTKDELLHMNIDQIYAPEVLDDVVKGFGELKEKGSALEIQSTLLKKDGTRLPVEVNSVSVYDKDGTFLCTRTILRDISERALSQSLLDAYINELKDSKESLLSEISEINKYQEKLRSTNKELEKVNQLKNDLIAMVSHDLKNPLGTIIGLSNLMIDDELAFDEVSDFSKRISSQAKQSLDLCENLLNSYKIESGSLKLYMKEVEIVELLRSSVESYEFPASQKNIEFNFSIGSDKVFVICDDQRVSQVFKNILSNSVKYAPENSKIEVLLTYSTMNQLVEVSISDQGPGLSEEEIKKLFDKEEQLIRKNLTGTGFGLSIVNDIVSLHKGKIEVTSVPNKKTSFLITLPNLIRIR